MMSRTDWKSHSNSLRRFRKARDLRLRDVARLVGIRDGPHISHWESSQRIPSLESALKLSAALGCPVEVLFSEQFKRIRRDVEERRQRYNIKRKH